MREVLKSIGKEQIYPQVIDKDIANLVVYLQLAEKDLDKIGDSDDDEQLIIDKIKEIRDRAKEEKPFDDLREILKSIDTEQLYPKFI